MKLFEPGDQVWTDFHSAVWRRNWRKVTIVKRVEMRSQTGVCYYTEDYPDPRDSSWFYETIPEGLQEAG